MVDTARDEGRLPSRVTGKVQVPFGGSQRAARCGPAALPVLFVAVAWLATGVASQTLVIAGNFQAGATTGVRVPANAILQIGVQQLTSIGPLSSGAGVNNGQLVNVVMQYQSVVVAGGVFSTAGDVVVNNIAQWDGMQWSALGGGTNNAVTALCEYNNLLIVGGLFDIAGNLAANRIASWNGYQWEPLGSGLTTSSGAGVSALAVFQNSLFVFGSFYSAGGISSSGTGLLIAAQFNGSSWALAGNSPCMALSSFVYNNGLVAVCSTCYFWNGVTWTSMGFAGNGLSAAVVYNNNNLVGADRWYGTLYTWAPVSNTWSQLAQGPWGGSSSFLIHTMIYYAGAIIAGGVASTNGPCLSGGCVISWNGQWGAVPLAIMPGSSITVYSLSIYYYSSGPTTTPTMGSTTTPTMGSTQTPTSGTTINPSPSLVSTPTPQLGTTIPSQFPTTAPSAPAPSVSPTTPATAAADIVSNSNSTYYILSAFLGVTTLLSLVCMIGFCGLLFGRKMIIRKLGGSLPENPETQVFPSQGRRRFHAPSSFDSASAQELGEISRTINVTRDVAPSAPPYVGPIPSE